MARMPPIYLDHNATTPILPEAADAVREASLRYGANPESQHEPGRQARRALEAARERIAEVLGASADDRIVFTSGGTESNNLAIAGLHKAGDGNAGPTRAALHHLAAGTPQRLPHCRASRRPGLAGRPAPGERRRSRPRRGARRLAAFRRTRW